MFKSHYNLLNKFIATMAAKLLKPSRLDTDPSSPTATKDWKHWYRTFTNFLEESGETAPDKLRALVNCVSPTVYNSLKTVLHTRVLMLNYKVFMLNHQMKFLLGMYWQHDDSNLVNLLMSILES